MRIEFIIFRLPTFADGMNSIFLQSMNSEGTITKNTKEVI